MAKLLNDKKTIAGVGSIVVIVTTLLLAVGCGGQKDAAELDGAIALARQADEALAQQQWNAYAAVINTEDLDKFKTMLVLEFERLAMARNSDSITVFDQTFSLAQLREAKSDQFFGDIMTIIFRVSPDLSRSFTAMKNDYIGAVAENDSLIHVVTHTKMVVGTRHVDEMNVATVHRIEDSWKVGLSPKLQGVGFMLVESLQMQR